MPLGMIGDQKYWNSEAHKKYLSLNMKQPLVTFGPLWVLYKRLFWAHINSYCYDHLYIKKGKLSTFKQISIKTNQKIKFFCQILGFFLHLTHWGVLRGRNSLKFWNTMKISFTRYVATHGSTRFKMGLV